MSKKSKSRPRTTILKPAVTKAKKRLPKLPAAKSAQPTATGKAAPKRRSALDAAAIVLAKVKKPMNAKNIVDAMATTGLWKSPGGKTPHATLYTAVTMLPKLAA